MQNHLGHRNRMKSWDLLGTDAVVSRVCDDGPWFPWKIVIDLLEKVLHLQRKLKFTF